MARDEKTKGGRKTVARKIRRCAELLSEIAIGVDAHPRSFDVEDAERALSWLGAGIESVQRAFERTRAQDDRVAHPEFEFPESDS